jgi:hypothetical protein
MQPELSVQWVASRTTGELFAGVFEILVEEEGESAKTEALWLDC